MGGLTDADLARLCPEAGEAERLQWRVQLDAYADLLDRWARRMSLVAIGDLAQLGARHLAPALRLRPLLRSLPHARVLDVGSGGGLPAIPLKIVLPDMALTLVESRRRRCTFLREVVRTLGLGQVEILNQRLEEGDPGGPGAPSTTGPGRHGAATLRAVAITSDLASALRPWLSPGAFLVSSLPTRPTVCVHTARLLLDGAPGARNEGTGGDGGRGGGRGQRRSGAIGNAGGRRPPDLDDPTRLDRGRYGLWRV